MPQILPDELELSIVMNVEAHDYAENGVLVRAICQEVSQLFGLPHLNRFRLPNNIR